MLDLIIIGGSIAGTTAAVYAARRKLNFELVATELGGEVVSCGEIGNWPGANTINGFVFSQQLQEQLKFNSVTTTLGFAVQKLEKIAGGWRAFATKTNGEEKILEARAIIVATGVHPRLLDVPGEKELTHKGVTFCTVCDGPLFKNKIVTTVGGGNSAIESALMLSQIASKVFVVNRNAEFNGEQVLIDKLKAAANMEIIFNATTTKIEGTDRVSGLTYTDAAGATHTIETQGVMVHIGNTPNSDFVPVAKDNFKQIIVDDHCATSEAGIFSAGDVTNTPFKQIVIAAGMGSTAALAAIEYLNRA